MSEGARTTGVGIAWSGTPLTAKDAEGDAFATLQSAIAYVRDQRAKKDYNDDVFVIGERDGSFAVQRYSEDSWWLVAAHTQIADALLYYLPKFVSYTDLDDGKKALDKSAVNDLKAYVAGFKHTPSNHAEYWAGLRTRLAAFHAKDNGSGYFVPPSYFTDMPGQATAKLVGIAVNERLLKQTK
jgi:hypothetical protein